MANGVSIQDNLNHQIGFKSVRVYSTPGEQNLIYETVGDPHLKKVLWDNKLSVKWYRETDEIFYRLKLEGEIVFTGELAKAIAEDMGADGWIKLSLEESISALEKKSVDFKIAKSDCKINPKRVLKEDGTLELVYVVSTNNFTTLDDYYKFLENYEKEFDLIKLKTPRTTSSYIRRPALQIYVPGQNYIGNFLGGNYWEVSVTGESNTNRLYTKNHFYPVRLLYEINLSYYSNNGVEIEQAEGKYRGIIVPTLWSLDPFGIYLIGIQCPQYLYREGEDELDFTTRIRMGDSGTSTGGTSLIGTIEDSGGNSLGLLPLTSAWAIVGDSSIPTDYWNFNNAFGFDGNSSYKPDDNIYTSVEKIFYQPLFARWILPSETFGRTTESIPVDDFASVGNLQYRYVSEGRSNDLIVEWGKHTSEETEWGKNDEGFYYERPDYRYCPLLRSAWTDESFWLDRESFNSTLEESGRQEVEIKDAYRLDNVLKYLFAAVKQGEGVDNPMDLFYDDVHGDLPFPEFCQPELFYITPKSNILKGQYSMAAQKAPITLKNLTDFLKQFLNIYWVATGNTIELRMWGQNNGQGFPDALFNLSGSSGIKNPRNGKPWNWANEAIEFDGSDIPERSSWAWMDESTPPFNGHVFLNQGALVKADSKEEVRTSIFTADFDYMTISPGECSQDGFAIWKLNEMTEKYEIGPVNYLGVEYTVGNVKLSVSYLQHPRGDYSPLLVKRPTRFYKHLYWEDYTYEAVTIKPTANETVKAPYPLIENSSFKSILNIPALERGIKTIFGAGEVTEATVNILSRIVTYKLKHNPYESPNTQ